MGACGESRDIYRKEKSLNNHPYSISLEQAKIIKEQVEQCLCKIKIVGGGTEQALDFYAKYQFLTIKMIVCRH